MAAAFSAAMEDALSAMKTISAAALLALAEAGAASVGFPTAAAGTIREEELGFVKRRGTVKTSGARKGNSEIVFHPNDSGEIG